MQKIKLFEVITELELGGAQRSTLDLIAALDKNKYEVTLVTASTGMLLREAASIEGARCVVVPTLKRTINLFYDSRALIALYMLFRKEKPHIVHTHSSKAGIIGRWAARFAGVATILHTVHGWEFHRYQKRTVRLLYIFLEKMTASITDYIIAVTHSDIIQGLSCGIGESHRYRLIRYGINREEFTMQYNGIFRKQYGIADSCFLVGMIACFKPQKAPLDFVYAAARVAKRIREVKFVMVGDGYLRKKIVRLIERLGMKQNFILLGWRRDIPMLLSSFDVVALSSLWEGLPIVFLEAMASGKPIIATDINGNAEVVKNNVNGFLVEPKNHESLAARILHLYSDAALARRMGEAGRMALSEQFESVSMVSRIDALYRQCCQERGIA